MKSPDTPHQKKKKKRHIPGDSGLQHIGIDI